MTVYKECLYLQRCAKVLSQSSVLYIYFQGVRISCNIFKVVLRSTSAVVVVVVVILKKNFYVGCFSTLVLYFQINTYLFIFIYLLLTQATVSVSQVLSQMGEKFSKDLTMDLKDASSSSADLSTFG